MPVIHKDAKENLESTASGRKRNNSLLEPEPLDFTEAAWPHPIYTRDQMKLVQVAHRKPEGVSDRIALAAIRFMRSAFDVATGYRHPKPGREGDPAFQMTGERWLTRFVFLESIAGVPGMVAGMLRHLHSLRALRRDRAWIETLLEEASNERMHLLTFLKLTKPGVFMRLMLLAGQGVFFNMFFVAYLLSPRTCHRFVGYLEEEAIITYKRCIRDMDEGRLTDFNDLEVPDIAMRYWKMDADANMHDLISYICADEAKHREVNHTLANLDQTKDRNPFALYIDNGKPQPTKGLKNLRGTGWERDEIAN
ncbi:alternative oxidase-domain-containing protein [Dipodascopsis tothii]|uniref:alternative oxidase-domain-containing protein n=1 Tax=Dipodascopsis tothii TaxID=44089 RepID=UPI0034CFD7D8